MGSHFLHMLLFSTLVSAFFGSLLRHDRQSQLRLGLKLWMVMVGGALLMAYAMYFFQR
ncbi:MAG: hypothetical protein OEV00_11610 [Acidobacteriota bacterium]|nr:hypothetical protein [Acidobacteriota bacterium]MDH3785959.1 hypothetical protein [Acidobacteriota bacterium]